MLKYLHILLKSLKNTTNHTLLHSVAAIFPGLDTPSDTETHFRTARANAWLRVHYPFPLPTNRHN